MPDLLTTGLSALRATQRALDTTAHNIANVSTEGYSRQRVDFASRPPQTVGGKWIGTGVDASAVRRNYDQFVAEQLRSSGGNLSRLETFAAQAERVSTLLGDADGGVGASLQKFTDALNEVTSTPSSVPARQVLLSQANALVERLRSYDSRLQGISADVDGQLQTEVRDVSELAQRIADLNGDIATSIQSTGQLPNDLLDQRDLLIDKLATKVGVTVIAEGDATLNVFIGNGLPLVLGTTASEITTARDPVDPERLQLALQTPAGTVDISRGVSGGAIGGLMDFRRQVLDPARNDLGRIAVAISSQMNAQHREGMDLAGQLGGDFFNIGAVSVTDSLGNTGSATLAVTRANVGALTTHDYVLARTATGYTLRREDTGAAVTFTGTGTVGDPILADGLAIVVGAGVATGDQFVIHPTRDAIGAMSVAVPNATRIAAAAPIRAAATSGNTGSGAISPGEVLDATNAQLLTTANIVFTSASTYSINGGPNIAYTAGANIDVNGWRVQISGAPATGDSFSVRSNAGGVGDNRNAFALIDSLRAGVLNNGTTSVAGAADRLVTDVGLSTRAAQLSRDAEAVIHDSDIAARDSISGVNLDEEAANMLRFQQAYQASAQIIAIAGTLFDTLMGAFRR